MLHRGYAWEDSKTRQLPGNVIVHRGLGLDADEHGRAQMLVFFGADAPLWPPVLDCHVSLLRGTFPPMAATGRARPACHWAERGGTFGPVNRIEQRFADLRTRGQKGLVIYIGAGDPDLEATRQLALSLDRAGVDVLELGVPFSDPLADGIVNQLAAQRGLESGTTPARVLETVAAIRRESQVPLVLYIYFNLLHRVGVRGFLAASAKAGVDGLLVLDLPPEESENYEALMAEFGLCPIYLIAPTTPESRIAVIAPRARGFIYYVSREGVTGMQSKVSDTIGDMTRTIRSHSPLPIAVGFGISNPDQARQVAAHAEAIVVGSAVVNRIAELGRSPEMVPRVSEFVAGLAGAVRSV